MAGKMVEHDACLVVTGSPGYHPADNFERLCCARLDLNRRWYGRVYSPIQLPASTRRHKRSNTSLTPVNNVRGKYS
jgi:hypothetical protein